MTKCTKPCECLYEVMCTLFLDVNMWTLNCAKQQNNGGLKRYSLD